jgi:uncharacterized protein YeaC (DUF1315 family)
MSAIGIVNSNSVFSVEIEKLVNSKKMDYIDAVVLWCQKNNLEVEYAAGLIRKDPVLRSKVQVEAENLNVLKKGARLPV